MIELYTWPTPNGQKVTIMLEECELPYQVFPVDIQRGGQFNPEFLRISPNNKIPAMVDTEGPKGRPFPVFESGAMLIYLAEKTGKFLSKDPEARSIAIQWLMFQMGGLGPMLGQAHHFRQYAPEQIPYAIQRYTKEAGRLYGVMDKRLAERDYLAGELSIADFANIYSHSHALHDGRDVETPATVLGDGVRVTYHATVLAGVHMAADSMLGALGVATRDVASGDVALGIPAVAKLRKPLEHERPPLPRTSDPLAECRP